MRVDLLNDWADALEKLAETGDWEERGFDMHRWAIGVKPTDPLLGCGTVCCAYGVGTTLPSWKEAGLVLVQCKDGASRWFPISDPWETLGISERDFDILTISSKYRGDRPTGPVSPREVAKRIRKGILTEWAFGYEGDRDESLYN